MCITEHTSLGFLISLSPTYLVTHLVSTTLLSMAWGTALALGGGTDLPTTSRAWIIFLLGGGGEILWYTGSYGLTLISSYTYTGLTNFHDEKNPTHLNQEVLCRETVRGRWVYQPNQALSAYLWLWLKLGPPWVYLSLCLPSLTLQALP